MTKPMVSGRRDDAGPPRASCSLRSQEVSRLSFRPFRNGVAGSASTGRTRRIPERAAERPTICMRHTCRPDLPAFGTAPVDSRSTKPRWISSPSEPTNEESSPSVSRRCRSPHQPGKVWDYRPRDGGARARGRGRRRPLARRRSCRQTADRNRSACATPASSRGGRSALSAHRRAAAPSDTITEAATPLFDPRLRAGRFEGGRDGTSYRRSTITPSFVPHAARPAALADGRVYLGRHRPCA